jgi:hypothetical protein
MLVAALVPEVLVKALEMVVPLLLILVLVVLVVMLNLRQQAAQAAPVS